MDHERRQVVTVKMMTYTVMRSLVLCKSLVTPPFGLKVVHTICGGGKFCCCVLGSTKEQDDGILCHIGIGGHPQFIGRFQSRISLGSGGIIYGGY